MFELVRSLGIRGLAMREAIPFALSLLITEILYKFHSFTLEVVAFLVTWFVLDAMWSIVYRSGKKPASSVPQRAS